MQLRYANAEHSSIEVVLHEGESLATMAGPRIYLVPIDDANTDYAKIIAEGIAIEPYTPTEEAKP